jgi:hypothetical protein
MENELKALRTWSSMLSEAQHTTAIYQLIQETTLAQVHFLLQALKLRETELGPSCTMSGDSHRGIKTFGVYNIILVLTCLLDSSDTSPGIKYISRGTHSYRSGAFAENTASLRSQHRNGYPICGVRKIFFLVLGRTLDYKC